VTNGKEFFPHAKDIFWQMRTSYSFKNYNEIK